MLGFGFVTIKQLTGRADTRPNGLADILARLQTSVPLKACQCSSFGSLDKSLLF